jgi:hypothetical protein
MVIRPWLAIVAGLLLFGCAASPPVNGDKNLTAQVQPQVESPAGCSTVSAQDLIANMQKSEVRLKADLEGEPLAALVKFLTDKVEDISMPQRAERAMVFEKDGAVLIVWLKDNCALGHTIGPWSAVKEFLGEPV